MGSFLKKFNKGSKGFTLIELLIVIAILGVLAAVILPNFTGVTERGVDETKAAELRIVQAAVDVAIAKGQTITAVSEATNSVSDLGLTAYLRGATTQYLYTIDAQGNVSQQ